MLRAGIWKPRTRPNSFEGVGEIGLPWIKAAGKEFNLPVTVEVANPEHVEAALKNEIDVLWIGARSTVSPFTVQEIADSLRGVDIPVLIKNPINPDLELWLGAIERFYQSGIKKLGVIHRAAGNLANHRNRQACAHRRGAARVRLVLLGDTRTETGCGEHQFRNLRTDRVVLIRRQSNRCQDADDRNHDHQFDQGKTLLNCLH